MVEVFKSGYSLTAEDKGGEIKVQIIPPIKPKHEVACGLTLMNISKDANTVRGTMAGETAPTNWMQPNAQQNDLQAAEKRFAEAMKRFAEAMDSSGIIDELFGNQERFNDNVSKYCIANEVELRNLRADEAYCKLIQYLAQIANRSNADRP